ncbi:unnamed protein product [Heligmosomoides polygyrus]|uniref:DDE Tnp4 domain-containing protein n=1 Tax=Heligmosomoides polygyrus TaxID=6339 RepID=A0A183FV88_HELPZ|nr:unnamed protein product [Heligmosomoides polygyrus]
MEKPARREQYNGGNKKVGQELGPGRWLKAGVEATGFRTTTRRSPKAGVEATGFRTTPRSVHREAGRCTTTTKVLQHRLLALVDADYRCIIYNLGATGRSSDAGVFSRCAMKAFLEDNDDDFPQPQQLGNMGKGGDVPCHFLVDQGFRQTVRFIRPHSQVEASKDIKCAHFNLVQSRILMREISGPPAVAWKITLAIMILHNLLVESVGAEVAVQRFGFTEPIQEAEEPRVSGNVP